MRAFHLVLPLLLSTTLCAQEPVLTIKLTDAYPVEMPELRAYALLANASLEEPHTIASVTFTVDGNQILTELVNGAYQAWWTPASYGQHSVSVVALASNGESTTESVTVEVNGTVVDRTERSMDGAIIDWTSMSTQWHQGTYTLPQHVGAYDRIMAHLIVTCPSVPGGCDDWDRLAYIQAKAPNGEWVEIIRYITPYGKACDHTIDVTDFASILQGNTEIRMYIDTWGTGGWKMDLDLTFEAGTPEFLYSTVRTAWHGNYNFGNPSNLQPSDTVTIDPGWGVESASLRLVTSGHGWGNNNTGNAAEFFHATHHVYVNGTSFTQDLWTICNPNPDGCQPQSGTWQYARAGWCPGAVSRPYQYDLTPLLGGPMELMYIFQENYVDNCHPNNPNCVSGQTCPDCNDGYNPFYRVGAYLITRSNTPLNVGVSENSIDLGKNGLLIGPNPNNGQFTLQLQQDMGDCVVTVHDVSGATLKTWFFRSLEQLNAYQFDLGGMAAGNYFVKVQNQSSTVGGTVVVQ